MDVSFVQLVKALLFTNFCFSFANGFQNFGLCGDSYCTVPIGEGITLSPYTPDAPEKLRFSSNENVLIFAKDCGKRHDYFGVTIGDRRGYVPTAFVKETKSLVGKSKLVSAQVDFLAATALSDVPSSSEGLQWSSDVSEKEASQFQQGLSSSFPPSRLVPPNSRSSDQPNVADSFSGHSKSEWDQTSWAPSEPAHQSSHQESSFDPSHAHFSGDSSSFASQNAFLSSSPEQFYDSLNTFAGGHEHSQNAFGGDYSSSYDVNYQSSENFIGGSYSNSHKVDPQHLSSQNAFGGGYSNSHEVDPPHLSSQNAFGGGYSNSHEVDPQHLSSQNAFGGGYSSSYDVYPDGSQNAFLENDHSSYSSLSSHHSVSPQQTVQFVTQDGHLLEQNEDLWKTLRMLEEQGYDYQDHAREEAPEQVAPSFAPGPPETLSSSTPTLDEEEVNVVEITAEETEPLSTVKTEILKSQPDILSSRHENPSLEQEIASSKPVLSEAESLTSGTQMLNSETGVADSRTEIKISKPDLLNSQVHDPTSQTQIQNFEPSKSEAETTNSRTVIPNPGLETSTYHRKIPISKPDILSRKEEILSSRFAGSDEVSSETEALLYTTEAAISNPESSSEKSDVPSFEAGVSPTLSFDNVTPEVVVEPIVEQNSSEAESSDFFQSRHLKEEFDQSPEETAGFDIFVTLDNGLQAIGSFVEVFISWLPEPLLSVLSRGGLSPRVSVFTLVSSLPCLSLIAALCYIKEKSKEKKLTALLAQSEKNVYELSAQKNILEEKIEKTSDELKSSSSMLDSERTSYEAEVESLRKSIKAKTLELERRVEEIKALKERQDEHLLLEAEHEEVQGQLARQKIRVLELEESASNLHCEIAQKESELESLQKEQLQLLQASKDSEERLSQLQQNCNQLLKEAEIWNMKVEELTAQLGEASSEKEEARSLLAARDEEVQSLTHLVQNLKSFEEVSDESKAKDEVLKELLNATSLLIKLEKREEENQSLSEELLAEKNRMIEKDVELLESRSEAEKLKLSYNRALQDRTEAQTKLDVLTNYFKDKEIQMQREIGAQEAVREKREKDADSAERRILLIEQENSSYKYQVASMKQEMEETERNLKSQIATQEKKAHENWIAARAAERRLEDMKQEMSILKQRLTLLEQEASAARQEVLRPKRGLGEEELPPLFPPPPMMLPLDRPLPPHLLPPMDGPFRPPWHLEGPPDFTPPRGEPRHSSPLLRDGTPPPLPPHEGRPPFFPPFPPPPMWPHRKPDDPSNHSSNRSHHSDSWQHTNSKG